MHLLHNVFEELLGIRFAKYAITVLRMRRQHGSDSELGQVLPNSLNFRGDWCLLEDLAIYDVHLYH
jgi:hypothetical protein